MDFLPFLEVGSEPDARVAFARPLLSALRASHFLLLRQKKVSKEKATPGYAVGVADFPALLATGGRCGTRAYGPQTVLALFPPAAALLGASHGDPKSVAGPGSTQKIECDGRHKKESNPENNRLSPGVFPSPLRGAEQRRFERKKGEDCLRAQPEFRSPRSSRVAQGTRVAGTDPGSPSFCLLFLGEARKSETPRKGGTLAKYRQ